MSAGRSPVGSTPIPEPCGSSVGSSETSDVTPICSAGTRLTNGLCGGCGELSESPTPCSAVAASSTSNDSLLRPTGRNFRPRWSARRTGRRPPMTHSYTQISQYLRCPRSYRYRYLDGWREKDSRASLCFGRCFEKALAAFFEGADPGAVLFKEWGAYRDVPLQYSHGDDWERLLRQGIGLLEQFVRDNRIRIRQPKSNMQKKIVRPLANGNDFVAYVDAIGQLDGTRRLLEWKTTSARYPEHEQPEGLTSLDLQLVCYSWISDISDVAIVTFVRKRVPEIQYLLASITDEQRREFGQMVEATARQIETAQFPAHPGIRFPQNGCVSCAHLGLCLGNETLAGTKFIRQPGASDLDWLDVLDD